jgi:antitoxin MazE
MSAIVKKWGNSLGLRIPQALARQVHLEEGSQVQLTVDADKLVIEPQRRRYSLEKLLAGITARNRHDEVDTGGPVGREQL